MGHSLDTQGTNSVYFVLLT